MIDFTTGLKTFLVLMNQIFVEPSTVFLYNLLPAFFPQVEASPSHLFHDEVKVSKAQGHLLLAAQSEW